MHSGPLRGRSRTTGVRRPTGIPAHARTGHRTYGTATVRVSLVIQAPSRDVHDWCTDYRSDDRRLYPASWGPRPSFRVIRISPRRVVWIRAYRESGRDPEIAVDEI
jgi:hypothetical protein